MNTPEQAPQFDFDMGDFDINAAFQEAITGVASDTELALDEKVRRMEVIVSEGTSEVYRDFVDLRSMAAQMEMMCTHNHALDQSVQGSEILSGFIDSHKPDDKHDHGNNASSKNTQEDTDDDDDDEIDPKTGKKVKKKRSWLDA